MVNQGKLDMENSSQPHPRTSANHIRRKRKASSLGVMILLALPMLIWLLEPDMRVDQS
jgi:hypothetical protein